MPSLPREDEPPGEPASGDVSDGASLPRRRGAASAGRYEAQGPPRRQSREESGAPATVVRRAMLAGQGAGHAPDAAGRGPRRILGHERPATADGQADVRV